MRNKKKIKILKNELIKLKKEVNHLKIMQDFYLSGVPEFIKTASKTISELQIKLEKNEKL